MPHYSLDYLAGFIDGEGYFVVHGDRGQIMRVGVGNSDQSVLLELHRRFGGTIIREGYRPQHHKTFWRWEMANAVDIKRFLEQMTSRLHQKRLQAEVMFGLV